MSALPQLAQHLFNAHRVSAFVARLQPGEGAKQARRLAHVGRFQAQVVIEVGARAVTTLPFAIGEPPDREEVGVLSKRTPSSTKAARAAQFSWRRRPVARSGDRERCSEMPNT